MECPSEDTKRAIQALPPELRQPLERFFQDASEANLDAVLVAALNDFAPGKVEAPVAEDADLIKDLGFDSLSITEFVFFFEDVFQIRITNEQLAAMRTYGELKRYLRGRLA